ncbi:uncharacterized protein LOC144639341 [Oculina patagonica]
MSKAVEPFANISAQELLKNTPKLFGWVRKEDTGVLRSVVKALDWPWRYMILSAGCLYLYKNSDDQNFSETIPLTKFRVCDAQEKNKYPWAFKMIHESTDVKTLYFAVDTDFDLKKWQDAITDERIKYCGDVSRTDDADGYCSIDEKPPPARSQSVTKRPPAPLPQRPHSNSSPAPFLDCNPPRNTLPVPSRRQSSDFSQHLTSRSLPRPPDNRTKPARPLTMGTFPKGISEPTKSSKGYEDVVNQLASTNLRSPNKEGSVSSSTPSPRVGSGTPGERKKIRRGNPDGESFKEKGGKDKQDKERVLPNSALRLDTDDKDEIYSMVQNKQGVYVVRKSLRAQSKMAVSVWTGDRVRHYVIFHIEGTRYALDPKGPSFDKMEDMIKHYYDFNLPNCDTKFSRPYE